MSISTAGSAFDTTLAVYVGTALASLERLAENNNDQLGRKTSEVSLRVRAGEVYSIAVDTADGTTGDIQLVVTYKPLMRPLGRLSTIHFHSEARGINSAFQVVGFAWDKDDRPGSHRAFLWTPVGGMTPLSEYESEANAVNERGQIIGYETGRGRRAVLWQDGHLIRLPLLSDSTMVTFAYAINNRGEIAGSALVPSPRGEGQISRAVLWRNEKIIDLGLSTDDEFQQANGINDAGQVVGFVRRTHDSVAPNRAFLWENGIVIELPPLEGDDNAVASDVNNRGDVVGYSSRFGEGPASAVLWRERQPIKLNAAEFEGGTVSALCNNDQGQIAGRQFFRGIYWPDDSAALVDPGKKLSPGWESNGVINGVNETGYFVGSGVRSPAAEESYPHGEAFILGPVYPLMLNVGHHGAEVELRWRDDGTPVQLEYSEDFSNWTPRLGSATNSLGIISSRAAFTGAKQFFRLRRSEFVAPRR